MNSDFFEEQLDRAGDLTLEHIAQRSWGISLTGDMPKLDTILCPELWADPS